MVGIAGLNGHVLKSVTLASSEQCPSLAGMSFDGKPIVRVVLDTEKISDLPQLKQGMKLLHQADPCCDVPTTPPPFFLVLAYDRRHVRARASGLTGGQAGR